MHENLIITIQTTKMNHFHAFPLRELGYRGLYTAIGSRYALTP